MPGPTLVPTLVPTLGLLIAAGAALVAQNLLMAKISAATASVLAALLVNSAVGLVLLTALLFRQAGLGGMAEITALLRPWFVIPGLLGTFFVFASVNGYQSLGAAPTIATLVASQLLFGLIWDLSQSEQITLRDIATATLGTGLLISGVIVLVSRGA